MGVWPVQDRGGHRVRLMTTEGEIAEIGIK
jgi:hypothetical protein